MIYTGNFHRSERFDLFFSGMERVFLTSGIQYFPVGISHPEAQIKCPDGCGSVFKDQFRRFPPGEIQHTDRTSRIQGTEQSAILYLQLPEQQSMVASASVTENNPEL